MKWKNPPIAKIYEALGSVADGRVEVAGNTARVYSSSRNKYYDITFDVSAKAIMSNDNGSYWQGYLGYPPIAFLMKIGMLSYDPAIGDLLKGVAWKDINQKFKNDFVKGLEYVLSSKTEDERKRLDEFARRVHAEIKSLDLDMLGEKAVPPRGY